MKNDRGFGIGSARTTLVMLIALMAGLSSGRALTARAPENKICGGITGCGGCTPHPDVPGFWVIIPNNTLLACVLADPVLYPDCRCETKSLECYDSGQTFLALWFNNTCTQELTSVAQVVIDVDGCDQDSCGPIVIDP